MPLDIFFGNLDFRENRTMKLPPLNTPDRIADFLLKAQRTVLIGMASALNEAGLSFSQYFLMGLVGETPLTQIEIAGKLGISDSAVTGIADKLQRLGYAMRADDSLDRRVKRLTLTPKGRETMGKLRGKMVQIVDEQFFADQFQRE